MANPYEAERLVRWLQAAGYPRVSTGDGGDDTLAEFQSDPADVIVLAATLDGGDSLALSSALRAERPGVPLVLIGDEQGPVRTALDAMEYSADRFLRRPVAEKALVFSVKSCLGTSGLGGVAGNAAAVPQIVAPLSALEPTTTPAAPEAAPGVAIFALTSRMDALASEMMSIGFHDDVDHLLAQPDEDEQVITPDSSGVVHAESIEALELTAEPPDDDAEGEFKATSTGEFAGFPPPPDGNALPDAEPEPAPPWREPTQILSAGSARPASPAPAPEPEPEPEPEPVQPMVASPPPPQAPPAMGTPGLGVPIASAAGAPVAPEEARTGTFAKEIRQKMSAIEKRLFGGESQTVESAVDLDGEGSGEIDLDKIGVDTLPGLSPAGDGRFVRGRTPAGEDAIDDAAEAAEEGPADIDPRGSTAVRHKPAQLPTQRGDLRDEDVAVLMARLHREGFTGKVVFRRGDAEKSISFAEGRPVFATSNLPHDRMGDLLYREGKITREQHARSREIVAETGRRMGEILVEMGFLKRRELLPAVRRHIEDVMYSLFAWDTGAFLAIPGAAAEDEKIRLATHPTALVVEGIRRKMSLERLRERVGGPATVIVPLKRDEIAAALGEADLAPDERHAADLFDGRRTLADVMKDRGGKLDETAVYQLALALLALGLARATHHDLSPGSDSARTTGSGSGAPSATPSLAGAADVAIDRERVLAKHAHVSEADYFAVLGVRRDATAFEIKRAYEASRRDYASESFPLEVQRELGEPLREIAVVLDEAYRVLKDDGVRGQYLRNLQE